MTSGRASATAIDSCTFGHAATKVPDVSMNPKRLPP
eukprot:CAMPEP_0115479974 /NCGR_PEP_ID=MMETSP0271-20121206/57022_1 /TAXON_ID=71861 /ORGANISM="Scrippsiella trochoidea, Strain CCMP3099" /LENGTH=35 /DNA_ID= /DNA_START= /DNA_END= /DNA_ORIENTATION=